MSLKGRWEDANILRKQVNELAAFQLPRTGEVRQAGPALGCASSFDATLFSL